MYRLGGKAALDALANSIDHIRTVILPKVSAKIF